MSITNEKINTSGTSLNKTVSSKMPGRSIGNLSSYSSANPSKTLSEGEIVKGEVTDLRNNEISITLEDNTRITGRLENASSLSIGDTAAFKVVELSYGKITLKTISQSESLSAASTINKALEEAGLQKNERNQTIVRELLANQMPINKQSIQAILQQSCAFKNAGIDTLVLMNRLNLPLTQESTEQFEQYRTNRHPLLYKIADIADKVPELFKGITDAAATCDLGKQLLSSVLTPNGMAHITPVENPEVIFPSKESAMELVNFLEPFSENESLKVQILNGTATLRDIIKEIRHCMEIANEVDARNLAEAAAQSDLPDSETISASEVPKTIELFNNSLTESLFQCYNDLQYENNELGSFLDKNSRMQLMDLLKDFPFSEQMKEKILSGEATVREVLSVIKNMMAATDPTSVRTLFQSEEFKILLKEELMANWTLTPHSLQKENVVEEFYPKMYEQLTEIEKLVQTNLLGKDSSSLSEQLSQTKNNIDFMKTLNHMFTYMQLPMKLREQNIHGELYVYTKKKDLLKSQDNVKVLLHLDMEHLGSMDIHVTLANNQVSSKFYVDDKESGKIITDNISLLENGLNHKGFILHAEVIKKEREVDIVKDFIEKDIPVGSLKRYNFDIRA